MRNLCILLLIVLVSGGNMTGNVTKEKAGDNLVEYLNTIVDSEVELLDIEDSGALYEATIEYEGQQIPIYVTKDGTSYTSNLIPIMDSTTPVETTTPSAEDIVKSDKPIVELFVMTHCLFGTQAEKGFLPAIIGLGDSIDASIKFVHYYLHEGEKEEPYETPIQVCLREEQEDKFLAYLKEFLVDGDSDRALKEVGIDETALDDCVANRAEGYYAIDSELSEGYGVRGSPTLVVNGQMVQSGRSADAYVQTICAAFNEAPEECGTLDLDVASPSPGFGYGTTSSVANAQC